VVDQFGINFDVWKSVANVFQVLHDYRD